MGPDSPHPYLRLSAALWVCTPIALRQACCSRSKIRHKDPRGWSRTINWGDLQGDLLGSLSVWNTLKHPKDPNKPVLGSYAILIVDLSRLWKIQWPLYLVQKAIHGFRNWCTSASNAKIYALGYLGSIDLESATLFWSHSPFRCADKAF